MARLLFSFLALWAALSVSVCRAEPRFEVPAPGVALSFPRDHGAHPKFKTEWWYLTASLAAADRDLFADGTDFGIQLTFFRQSIKPDDAGGDWQQQYLAHAAVADKRAQSFKFEKRYVRGGLGVARVSSNSLQVEQGSWKLVEKDGGLAVNFDVKDGEKLYSVHLTAKEIPAVMLNGAAGYSKKGGCAECASFYYSLPRFELAGEITHAADTAKVRGIGWLDHEWMSGAIDSAQVGWNWFGVMTRSGDALMAFQLRDAAGAVNYASGTLLRGGAVRALSRDDFSVSAGSTWKSPSTAASYPSSWRIVVPGEGIDLKIAPVLADQELTGEGQQYWEGAVRSEDGTAVGYAELTGYVKAVGGF